MNNVNHDHNNNYNLILTRKFLLMAMRSCEGIKDEGQFLSVNSLGFAGTLAVKNNEALEVLRKKGPLKVLELVSMPTVSLEQTENDNSETKI